MSESMSSIFSIMNTNKSKWPEYWYTMNHHKVPEDFKEYWPEWWPYKSLEDSKPIPIEMGNRMHKWLDVFMQKIHFEVSEKVLLHYGNVIARKRMTEGEFEEWYNKNKPVWEQYKK